MTTPALCRLRERFPHAKIELLTGRKLADLWQDFPAVDAILTLAPRESPFSVARRLRAESFDMALLLPNSPRAALEAWFAGIPRRIGYAQPWRTWLLSDPVPAHPGKIRMRKRGTGEIRRLASASAVAESSRTTGGNGRRANAPAPAHHLYDYLFLAGALGARVEPLAPALHIRPEELERANAKLASAVCPEPREKTSGTAPVFLGLNASAAYGPAKCWPAERFAAAARELCQLTPNVVWLGFGADEDEQLNNEIAVQARVPFINLAGKTSLRELMAMLCACRALLTNDSGPMHLAAALGTPVVALFGSTSPELTGPGLPGDPRHVTLASNPPCSPCFRRTCPIDFRCMTGIGVEQVVAAVSRQMKA